MQIMIQSQRYNYTIDNVYNRVIIFRRASVGFIEENMVLWPV